MSGKKVKGIVVELGGDATSLSKAIRGVTSEAKDTQTELKKIERLLKMDPTNVTLLKQKQDLLNRSVEQTEGAVAALKAAKEKADADMASGTQVNEKAYRELERQIFANEQSLKDVRKKADEVARKLNDIEDDNLRDVSDAAQAAEKSLEEAGKEAASFGDVLKAEAIVEGAKGLLEGVSELAEETKEYRKIMGSLEISSEAAGYSAEQTAQTYKQLYGVLADDQSAATATANLQAMQLDQEKLTQMTNAAIGAWSRYGDSINIDSLSEAINHSAQLGEVQSSLADVLEWAGLSVDDFNAQLATCSSTSERADLILRMMADQGLTAAGEKWRENNASMVESNEVAADLQDQMAKLGEKIEPLTTKLTGMVVAALEWFNSLDAGTQDFILGTVLVIAALGPLMSGFNSVTGSVNTIISILPKLQSMFSSVLGFIAANPIVLLIGAIVGLVALIATKGDEIQGVLRNVDNFMQNVFAADWRNVFGPVLGGALNEFFCHLKILWDSVGMPIFNGIIDFIRGVFTGDWERAWNGVKEIFGGIFQGLSGMAKAPINAVIGIINGAIGGLNKLIKSANKLPGINISTISKIPYLANGGEVLQGHAVVGEAGPELLTVAGGRTIVQPLTGSTTNHNMNWGGMTVNVYGSPGQSVEDLADAVMDRIQLECDRREVAPT